MELPKYELTINEDADCIYAISLVDQPAIESNFLYFHKSEKVKFEFNEEQQIITGPALIPDIEIYRNDSHGEYNIFMSAQTIKDSAVRFFKNGYQNSTTLQHNKLLAGTTYFESWIVEEPLHDKSLTLGFKDVKKGTWFVSLKIHDKEIWDAIKEGDYFKGFSIEANFTFVPVNFSKQTIENKETVEFIKKIESKVEALQTELLTELENL